MDETVFIFWEGTMPAYLKLCMKTWSFPYTLLTYENAGDYIKGFDSGRDVELLKTFTLPMQADYIRTHVLRDNGGYWLDCDTIVLGSLPDALIFGDDIERTNTIGYLHAKDKEEPFFVAWSEYQDKVLRSTDHDMRWDIMGNRFTDKYLKTHGELTIAPIKEHWVETVMVPGKGERYDKYQKFYFSDKWTLDELKRFNAYTDIFMLHNSWTPGWYKQLDEYDVLDCDCTLSNILREVL